MRLEHRALVVDLVRHLGLPKLRQIPAGLAQSESRALVVALAVLVLLVLLLIMVVVDMTEEAVTPALVSVVVLKAPLHQMPVMLFWDKAAAM